MKIRNALPLLLFTAVAMLGLASGCGSKSGSDEKSKTSPEHGNSHDVPMTQAEKDTLKKEVDTYAKAITHIQQFRDTIKKETTTGEPEKAHRALDKLDLVLKWLPDIARDSKISDADDLGTVGTHSINLKEAFNKVHDNIDNKKKPDYEAVADKIEESVKALVAIKAS